MKKKLLPIFLTMLLCSFAFALVACTNTKSEEPKKSMVYNTKVENVEVTDDVAQQSFDYMTSMVSSYLYNYTHCFNNLTNNTNDEASVSSTDEQKAFEYLNLLTSAKYYGLTIENMFLDEKISVETLDSNDTYNFVKKISFKHYNETATVLCLMYNVTKTNSIDETTNCKVLSQFEGVVKFDEDENTELEIVVSGFLKEKDNNKYIEINLGENQDFASVSLNKIINKTNQSYNFALKSMGNEIMKFSFATKVDFNNKVQAIAFESEMGAYKNNIFVKKIDNNTFNFAFDYLNMKFNYDIKIIIDGDKKFYEFPAIPNENNSNRLEITLPSFDFSKLKTEKASK